jgi:L,D-transpeptidase YbiS
LSEYRIDVDTRLQRLYLWQPYPDGDILIREYPVSTSKNGLGEHSGSYCTPRGRHRIAEKIGEDQPMYAIFKARVPTGEIWSPAMNAEFPEQDWILTRILWLDGMEAGVNRGGAVDTHKRYIYIHGTSEEHHIGKPASHGCIRMRNGDIAELFDLVDEGTEVNISG